MKELKNIHSYKLTGTKSKEMFGLTRDHLVKFNIKDYDTKGRKHMEEFLNIIYYAGYLEVYKIPKKGELCYFWNGNDKNKSLVKGGPFIAKYEGVDKRSNQYLAKGSDMMFTYCQLVSDEELKGR